MSKASSIKSRRVRQEDNPLCLLGDSLICSAVQIDFEEEEQCADGERNETTSIHRGTKEGRKKDRRNPVDSQTTGEEAARSPLSLPLLCLYQHGTRGRAEQEKRRERMPIFDRLKSEGRQTDRHVAG